MKQAFFISNDKLAYLVKTIPFTVLERNGLQTKIEVMVTPYTLINLFYAGVQSGIDESFETIRKIPA